MRGRRARNRYGNLINLHRNNRVQRNRLWTQIQERESTIIRDNRIRMTEINRRIDEIRNNTINRMNSISLPRNEQSVLDNLDTYIQRGSGNRTPNNPILDNMTMINNRTRRNTGIPNMANPISSIDNRYNITRMTPYNGTHRNNERERAPIPPVLNNVRDTDIQREINRIRNTVSSLSVSPIGNRNNLQPIRRDNNENREIGRYNFRQFLSREGIGEAFTCPICMDQHYVQSIKLRCNHKICTTCMREYITTCLGDMMNKIPIKCPMSHDDCNAIIDTEIDGIDKLLTKVDFDKLEKYTIMKTYIDDRYLKYCPNINCGAPFDATEIDNLPQIDYKYKYCVKCFECNQDFCIKCNVTWHDGYTCEQYKSMELDEESQNNRYLNKYCRECPNCGERIQKQKSPEQEIYERNTGMNGGTYDCHHMECAKCKSHFCWTCMKIYGREYYHSTCPSSDCIIHFREHSPMIQGLPPGKIDYIYMYIESNTMGVDHKRILFSCLNRHIVLNNNVNERSDNVVRLYCNQEGIVKKLDNNIGEFTFRQESKGDFSKII